MAPVSQSIHECALLGNKGTKPSQGEWLSVVTKKEEKKVFLPPLSSLSLSSTEADDRSKELFGNARISRATRLRHCGAGGDG